jgi:serine/threonine protein kinase
VKLAQHKTSKQRVAIKIYNKAKLSDVAKSSAVQCEIMCMKKLQHPNICKLYDHFETRKDIYLIMEYVSGISLYQFLKNKNFKQNFDQCKLFLR